MVRPADDFVPGFEFVQSDVLMTETFHIDDPSKLTLVEERVTISKQEVETGRVQVSTRVEERQEQVREALRHEDVMVERVPIGRVVEAAPAPRQEGDRLVISIVEEILVVEKRLVLKEEVHIIHTSRIEHFEQDVTLRAMHADVQRTTTALQT